MTLLHLTLTHDRALIATDTACYLSDRGEPGADVLYHPDGTAAAMTKVYALPHIKCVLTGRGTSTVHVFAVDRVRYAKDFEHAVDLLADGLPRLVVEAGTFEGKPLRHSVYLVGWSEARGAMCRAEFESTAGYRPAITPGAGGWVGLYSPHTPHPAWVFDLAQADTRQDERRAYFEAEREREPRCLTSAAAYARHAVEHARTDDPRAPFGGRLVVAEVTRDGVQIVEGGDLGLPWRRPGAPDLLDRRAHMCIMANATSEAFADETGADSVTIPGTGGTSFKTCASRSYTNTTDRAVVVQLDAEVVGLHFSAGGTLAAPDDFCSASWVFEENGTPVLSDPFIDTTNDAFPPDATTKQSRQVGWQRTLNAGDTATLYLSVGGGTDVNAATISWARTRLRTTILKA